MKRRFIDVVLAFSFILPGSSQLINKNWRKGTALAATAIFGLLMLHFGSENISSLGFLFLLVSLMTNWMDMINEVFKPLIQDLHKIEETLERMLPKLEFIAYQLRELNYQLRELNLAMRLPEVRKMLPAPKELKLLPSGKRKLLKLSSKETARATDRA